jgi:hypothetical protein
VPSRAAATTLRPIANEVAVRAGAVGAILGRRASDLHPLTGHADRAPADGAAGLAFGGSGHADTTNSCSTRAASHGGFRGDAVQLWKGRERNGLRG